jgi:hypothetical protein
VRLPLQRSLFGRLGAAPQLLGLGDALPEGRFGAWLDQDGDLFVDRSHVERLAEALPARLTPERLDSAETSQRACCDCLVAATERAANRASGAGEAELRSLIGELGDAIAAVLPYGVLSKFVPDALLRALDGAGDLALPPFPRPSFGAELAGKSLVLYDDCLALGWTPQRLETEWPAVAPEVARLVRRFCRDQAGWGPLPWEARGYEDPRFVIGILRAAFDGPTPPGVADGPATRRPEPVRAEASAGAFSPVRRHLAFWLDFLERETWYVRSAFYRGMVPLLQRLAAVVGPTRDGGGAEALLFHEIGELRSGAVTRDASARRREYLADAAYVARVGSGDGRLAAIFRHADGPA